jgi:NADH:ubiquinone oxidoreductase subunit 5 (subunit L)/multisubunit Na+/H+ antiporter MnhA subunit
MLLGTLFLWLAAGVSGAEGAAPVIGNGWSDRALLMLLLAAMGPLGALPLQWWRPLAWSLPLETSALVHLAPVVAGGSLLARISSPAGGYDAGFLAIATSFGLLGLLVGVTIAWMYVASPGRSLSALALALAGVVVLSAAWTGTAGTLSAIRVLLLATSGLFLAARWAPRKLPWPAIVPLMALAGLPLTAGYSSLVAVYDAWLTGGGAVLLIICALLSMFLLAVGILAVRREVPAGGLGDQKPVLMARHYLALALPSLGLLMLPDGQVTEASLWAWIAVVVAVGGSLVLSRYETALQDAQLAIRHALHLGFIGRRLLRLFANIGSALDLLVRELAAILEGEGGMLWLLVFVVVIWLARR